MSRVSRGFRISWWDRVLISIAPRWGLRRVRARAAASRLQLRAGAYEAAAGGRRTAGWRRTAEDANGANGPAIAILRELSRDLLRNNAWARRAVQAIVNNTVGWGIVPKPIGVDDAVTKAALERWYAWANTTQCDYDGRLTFSGLQALALRTIVQSGEVLVVKEVASAADGLAIPIRLRVLEPDYLDITRDGVVNEETGNQLVQGIELDAKGRRVAYWLFDQHPGSNRLPTGARSGSSYVSRRVPAADVLHAYVVERPEQMRGVPWLTAAIAKLNDYDDYEDAVLTQQKVAACFAAFVQDLDGAATPLGQESTERENEEELQSGHISYLPPGKTVTFATPPSLADSGGNFAAGNLRRIAVALGVTYEDLTGDYSQVNFSSARMGRLAHWANVEDWRWNMLVPQICDGVWAWAMGLAAALEEWPAVPRAEWSAPPPPMLEPEKEGLSYARLLRAGTVTLFQMIRERGGDPRAHLQEIADGNALLDRLGIVLDSDPRRVTGAGMLQQDLSGDGTIDAGSDGEDPAEDVAAEEPADDAAADAEVEDAAA